MSGRLSRLEAAGVLAPVDVALGQLLATHCAHAGDVVGLAAALASAVLGQGHSCLPLAAIPAFVASRSAGSPSGAGLDLPSRDEFRIALRESPLVAADASRAAALVLDRHDQLYLRRYYCYEQVVAGALRQRLAGAADLPFDTHALRNALDRHFADTIADDLDQRVAVLLALRSRFLIVTGGPGSGKTSTVLRLLAIVIEASLRLGQPPPRIALTAPTGKAAARLAETLRAPRIAAEDAVRSMLPQSATTLHRLLGIHSGRSQPRYGRDHPLPFDLVVVDEASMLDLALAAKLCAALPTQTRLVLLGDRDQLASVEAGSVFGALCAAVGEPNRYTPDTSNWLQTILSAPNGQGTDATAANAARNAERSRTPSAPAAGEPAHRLGDALVELRGSHRFGDASAIGRFAHALRRGDGALAREILSADASGLRARAIADRSIAATIAEHVVPHFAALAGVTEPTSALDGLDRFRVLCAVREGPFGANAIGALIERELRRCSPRVDEHGWFPGRLVMITGNDYRQALFNGDIGIALASGERGAIEIWFRSADGTPRVLPPALLPKHEGAFALTVHKAQGSEFDHVLIVLPARDAPVLTRELLYTAVTRARATVELWTGEDILAATIARSTQRWSGLGNALGSA